MFLRLTQAHIGCILLLERIPRLGGAFPRSFKRFGEVMRIVHAHCPQMTPKKKRQCRNQLLPLLV